MLQYRPSLKKDGAKLFPESCIFKLNLDGDWYLEMYQPMAEELRQSWSKIQLDSVILVKTFLPELQEFRVIDIVKDTDGSSEKITARPIAYDCDTEVLLDLELEEAWAEDVLAGIFQEFPDYTTSSDISKSSNFSLHNVKLISAMFNSQYSFHTVFGGEPFFNNKHISINERIGSVKDHIKIEFGKNMISMISDEDSLNIITRMIPLSYNDRRLPEIYVNSPNIESYDRIYTQTYEMYDLKLKEDSVSEDEEAFDTEEELYEAMRERALEAFEQGVDKYNTSYSVEIVELERLYEGSNLDEILKLSIGDSVTVKHPNWNISTVERIIEYHWDCLAQKISYMKLGTPTDNMIDSLVRTGSINDKVNGVINQNGTIMSEKIQGVMDLRDVNLKAQMDVSQRQDVRAILFEDSMVLSPTFGALSLGTQGIQIARTKDSVGNWVWGTAIDFQSVNADFIQTGVLSDPTGKNYWDMVSGSVQFDNLRLNTEQVIFAWNSYSDFIQFIDNGLFFYKNGLVQAKISDDGLLIYDNGKYYSGYFGRSENSAGQTSIGMHMGNEAEWLGMFLREGEQSRSLWTYSKNAVGEGDSAYSAGYLNADANLDMRWNTITRANFSNCDFSGILPSGITGRIYITAITSMNEWGQPSHYEYTDMRFTNGILVDVDQS